MAAFQHIFPQTTSRAESPAKVFAKLKSKVNREASREKDGVHTRRDLLGKLQAKHGAEFMSPRKRTDELEENRGFGFVCEARALTISPMPSPQRNFGYSREGWSRKLAEDVVGEGRCGYTPMKGGCLESTVGSQPFDIASRSLSPTEAAQVRDGFGVIHRAQKVQAAGNQFIQELQSPLTDPPSVFSPMRSKLRKRKSPSSGLHVESCPGVLSRQAFHNTLEKSLDHLKGLDMNQIKLPARTRKIFR